MEGVGTEATKDARTMCYVKILCLFLFLLVLSGEFTLFLCRSPRWREGRFGRSAEEAFAVCPQDMLGTCWVYCSVKHEPRCQISAACIYRRPFLYFEQLWSCVSYCELSQGV